MCVCVCVRGREREREREEGVNKVTSKGQEGSSQHYPQFTIFIDGNVAWLQVLMNDPSGVNILKVKKTEPVIQRSNCSISTHYQY